MFLSKFIKLLYWDIHKKYYWFILIGRILNFFPGESGNKLRGDVLSKFFKSSGVGLSIHEQFQVTQPDKLEIGNYVSISCNCFIQASGGVKIGNHVLLGPDVKIWSINHKFDNCDILIKDQNWTYERVEIGNDVWIGANSIILPGVKVPDGVVIGAGSVVVNKEMDSYSIYCGNPTKKIKSRI